MNWHDQLEEKYIAKKEIRIKTHVLRADLWKFSDAYIVVKGDTVATAPDYVKKEIKRWHLKIMHHWSTALQRSMEYKLIMQKI